MGVTVTAGLPAGDSRRDKSWFAYASAGAAGRLAPGATADGSGGQPPLLRHALADAEAPAFEMDSWLASRSLARRASGGW